MAINSAFEVFDGDLFPHPAMARNVSANWLAKLFPGRVMVIKPLEDYVKISDPQGYPMWATIKRKDRTIRLSHKIILMAEAVFDENELHRTVGLANKQCRYNRFLLMKGEEGWFIYVISEIPVRERVSPGELLERCKSHWFDFQRGLKVLEGYCRRANVI